MAIAFVLLFISVIVISSSQVQSDPNYCFSSDAIKPQLAMFSTKTSYQSVRGSSVDPNVSNCTPKKFWLLQRHGTRLANANQISKFPNIPSIQTKAITNHDNGKGTLCRGDLKLIREWKLDANLTESIAEYLTLAGWMELENIARRYQSAFPSLLPSTYSRSNYLFQHTDTQRTQGSFRAFADGLFGYNGYKYVEPETIPALDLLLKPFDFCVPWLVNSGLETEMAAFEKGPEYDTVISNVNRKLGGASVSKSHVRSMWQLCRFEQATDMSTPSPWCSVFSIDDVAVMEYGEDLGYYYEAGYGFDMNKNILCEAMQNMLQFLQYDGEEAPARILISHSTSMQLILVALGLYEDEVPMTRSNFAEQYFRKWRTSEQTAFASNLAVIRYDCVDDDNDVLFLYNERPLQIPGCQSNGNIIEKQEPGGYTLYFIKIAELRKKLLEVSKNKNLEDILDKLKIDPNNMKTYGAPNDQVQKSLNSPFQFSTEHVILNIGTFDLLNGRSVEDTLVEIVRLLNAIKAKNLQPILTTLAPLPNHLDSEFERGRNAINKFIRDDFDCIDIEKCFVSNKNRVLLECYQGIPTAVSGSKHDIILWNRVGRQRVLQLMKREIPNFHPVF